MLGAGDRILDGFTASLGNAAHDQPAFAGVDVHVEIYGAKIGSYIFSRVVENTWKMVAPGSVS